MSTLKDSFEALRAKKNKQILIDNYRNTLNNEKSTAIERRYASDMLVALTYEDRKAEINEFWNALDVKHEIKDNKIAFLHETVECLRDLVAEIANEETTSARRNSIFKDVANKDFLKNISARVKERILAEEKRIEDEIAKKDAEYKKKINEALKLNS